MGKESKISGLIGFHHRSHYNGGCEEHFMFLFFLTKIHYTIRNKCFQSNGFESNKLAINFDNIFSP